MNRIKQLREKNKLSQSELGKKLNKTQQQISLYEKGVNELDLDGYILLSKLFNCSIEYIAGKSDINNFISNNSSKIINTDGLSEEEILELQKQIEYMKWKKENK